MKIYVASFNRASDGALSKLIHKMKENGILSNDYTTADYILAVGDRIETFDFTLQQFRKNKPIIHLWAGEVCNDWSTEDEVYRHAITLMSMMQLCTNSSSHEVVMQLCKAVGKEPNVYTIGNLMLDNLEIDESIIPEQEYDLVLYNPPTLLDHFQILEELDIIKGMLDTNTIWIEPNGDKGSEYIEEYVTHKNFPRPQFLGLLKHCKRFITNSSCQYYEAQFLMDKNNIISIGIRNSERTSKHADMSISNVSDNIIKILKELK